MPWGLSSTPFSYPSDRGVLVRPAPVEFRDEHARLRSLDDAQASAEAEAPITAIQARSDYDVPPFRDDSSFFAPYPLSPARRRRTAHDWHRYARGTL